MPVLTIPRLLASLISLAFLATAAYLLWSWHHGYDFRAPDGTWHHADGPIWRLYAGAALASWSLLGRLPLMLMFRPGEPLPPLDEGSTRTVEAADGSRLRVHVAGREDGPTLVLTHGWGMDSTIWRWVQADLGRRFRLVTWDLPGLGKSTGPADGHYSIDRFASCLGSVIEATSAARVVLVGHSIGGMTAQTLFRACPQVARAKVAGLVLVDTTFLNPLRTMLLSRLWLALQKPLLEPISQLTIAVSPIVWLSNWQSYWSGSAQLAMRLSGFGRFATGRQVDYAARLSCQGSPAVQAKGNLAMFRWDAAGELPGIAAPTLAMAGTKDIVTLPAASTIMASSIPNARELLMEGAGHMGFMERAAAYSLEIGRFAELALADLPSDRPGTWTKTDAGSRITAMNRDGE